MPNKKISRGSYFNSRPSARGDSVLCASILTTILFQFTPLREGRLGVDYRLQKIRLFQFTPLREGRRIGDHVVCAVDGISIHAPPRGATIRNTKSPDSQFYFNSRPSARGDTMLNTSQCAALHFNSRPSARGDAVAHGWSHGRKEPGETVEVYSAGRLVSRVRWDAKKYRYMRETIPNQETEE